jgi:hypothetical protein
MRKLIVKVLLVGFLMMPFTVTPSFSMVQLAGSEIDLAKIDCPFKGIKSKSEESKVQTKEETKTVVSASGDKKLFD